MNKAIISDRISVNATAIREFLQSLDEDQLNKKPGSKWSAAENTIHLIKSVAPINLALGLPRFSFILFGKADTSKTYDEVIAAYTESLAAGAKASRAYVPGSGKHTAAAQILKRFDQHYKTLIAKLSKWSEEDLDTYRLPHPIIGKLTVREMLYFTIYHLEHHLNSMRSQVS